MPERKTVYHKSVQGLFPEPVADALEVVQDLFRSCSKFDTAVLKRYEGQSEAYNWHREPEEYVGNGDREMVLWTISGRAQLEVMTDGANIPIAFDCMPDSAKKLPAHTRHRVHPPDPVFGTRVLLWFGQRK
jgi:hypothetical protein